MESLLANYASSDEEEEQEEQQPRQPPPPPSSLFSSLPQPKSSSLFSSLPQPKQPPRNLNIPIANPIRDEQDSEIPKPCISHTKNPSNLFSSLPQPKSQAPPHPPNPPNVKRIVQFKPPLNPKNYDDEEDDDDDDDEEKERRKRRESETLAQGPSVTSFLSSIPAPRNSTTLGAAPSSGSGRRSIIETQVAPAASESNNEPISDQNAPIYESGVAQHSPNYISYGNYESSSHQNAGNYESGFDQNVGNYSSYQSSVDPKIDAATSYESYDNYHGQYENNWVDGSTIPETRATAMADLGVKVKGKRGRNELPTEIVEVKQDELMKNRPREDQVKMTGIAFGPSYQPASTKGKPSKLHKRKHQIGSLLFDMKQKQMELQERRSRGLLTKSQTQAKYGW
ncbi:hypothetical protein CCACVL1_15205 [Corchorus capsularis]|uniref:Proline-rich protein PRCC n=2 Tax=Corchorus TaxID=93758 RepID=A0A1R3I3D7_COCAP|nr:hypothetical protein CCACVL1_15205 [Corchorus capsularis]